MLLAHGVAHPWLKWRQSVVKTTPIGWRPGLGCHETQVSFNRFDRRLIMIAERHKSHYWEPAWLKIRTKRPIVRNALAYERTTSLILVRPTGAPLRNAPT
jgi:hypothetical protein